MIGAWLGRGEINRHGEDARGLYQVLSTWQPGQRRTSRIRWRGSWRMRDRVEQSGDRWRDNIGRRPYGV